MDVMEFKKHIGFEEESEMEEKGNETGRELQVVETNQKRILIRKR